MPIHQIFRGGGEGRSGTGGGSKFTHFSVAVVVSCDARAVELYKGGGQIGRGKQL